MDIERASELHTVTSEEVLAPLNDKSAPAPSKAALAWTVATEPARMRVAVAEALRDMANRLEDHVSGHTRENGQLIAGRDIIARIRAQADAVEIEGAL